MDLSGTKLVTDIAPIVISLAGVFFVVHRLMLILRQMKFNALNQFYEITCAPEIQKALRFVYCSETRQLMNPKVRGKNKVSQNGVEKEMGK